MHGKMHTKIVAGVALVTLTALLAGCTGQFNVKQTDPIRIQLEGAPQTVTVANTDSEPKKVVVENPQKVEQIRVEVTVTRTSTTSCSILVTVQDADSGATITTATVQCTSPAPTTTTTTAPPSTTTSPPPTTTTTTAPPSGNTVIQNIYVNAHGKNIIVITQAQQGSANVNIAAHGSTQVVNSSSPTPTSSPA